MTFNVLTLFPEMFLSFKTSSIAKRAIESELIEINSVNIRDYTLDKHKKTDDYPFGGGAGMVMTPQPIFDCFDDIAKNSKAKKAINIYMSPKGKKLDDKLVRYYKDYDEINILCGHYEGVDQRVIDELIDEEISIGDYILTGGELAAMVLIDVVMRFIPNVLGNFESPHDESFSNDLLEYPHYTRPADYKGLKVPDILLSGHHKNIEKWRKDKAIEITKKVRPDILKNQK